MRRPLEVKVCGMREAENIIQTTALSVDYIGCIFVPTSPRFFGDIPVPGALRMLVGGSKTVAVVADPQSHFISELAQSGEFDVIQIHGEIDPDTLHSARDLAPRIQFWKAINIGQDSKLLFAKHNDSLYERVVFDGRHSGSGESFDWDVVKQYTGTLPFMIAGGIGCHNITSLMKAVNEDERCIGVDVNSKVEHVPGFKNVEAIRQLLEVVRRCI